MYSVQSLATLELLLETKWRQVYTNSVNQKFNNRLEGFHYDLCWLTTFSLKTSLRRKCPNTELFLVRIFLYSD